MFPSFPNPIPIPKTVPVCPGVLPPRVLPPNTPQPNLFPSPPSPPARSPHSNDPMSPAEFWSRIPPTVRGHITHLGRCLGTGSVKQVHVARFDDGKEWAIAILRRGVENEALASIDALEASEELGPVASRLGRLMFNEFNLFGEGETLEEFSTTRIGTHRLFRVVKVKHHSPRCLVEEIANGPELTKILDKKYEDEAVREVAIAETKELLAEYHRAVFSAFIEDGLIHSDIHLGNAIQSTVDADGTTGFILFDVGQYDRAGPQDTKALLWTLSAISTIERRKTLRHVALKHLERVSTIRVPIGGSTDDATAAAAAATAAAADADAGTGGETGAEATTTAASAIAADAAASATTAATPAVTTAAATTTTTTAAPPQEAWRGMGLRGRLSDAFDESISPFEDGSLPDQRQAYMLFLRAAEKREVQLPNAAFAVAKMIDGMLSQATSYDLPPVVDESVEGHLSSEVTYGELASIAAAFVRMRLGLS